MAYATEGDEDEGAESSGEGEEESEEEGEEGEQEEEEESSEQEASSEDLAEGKPGFIYCCLNLSPTRRPFCHSLVFFLVQHIYLIFLT